MRESTCILRYKALCIAEVVSLSEAHYISFILYSERSLWCRLSGRFVISFKSYAILSLIMQAISQSGLTFHNLVGQALEDPAFLVCGGTLKFACQHRYPHEKSTTFLMSDNQLQLKGADACLVALAHSLGLKVDVKLRSEVDEHWDDDSHQVVDISQAHTTNGEH